VIAGGVESMSLLPMAGWKTVPNYDIAKANGDYYLSMGLTAEEVATDYKISREEQDRFAYESHQKALNAINKGYFEDGILPIEVEDIVYQDGKRKVIKQTFKVDEGPRADTTLEALAQLKPVFAQIGTVTAGNASQTSDGAAFVLVMSEASLKASGLKPWARMLSCVCVGVDPRIMGIGPIEAIPKALMKAQLKIEDIDLFEINEAFASQSLAIIKTLGLDPQKVNVNGGAIALGHPLGCSGAKLTIQLLHDLKRMGKQYGVVSACVGGGQGIAAVFERLD
jgi:acetyl-CoA acyltransferase